MACTLSGTHARTGTRMQACSAASFKLPQYIDASGHPDTCDQPSREMADLMEKALEDLAEAERFVWQGALIPVLRGCGVRVAWRAVVPWQWRLWRPPLPR